MISAVASFAALFAAVFSLLMGVGLLGTYLNLRMAIEGFSTQVTGLILAAYFIVMVHDCDPIRCNCFPVADRGAGGSF